MGLTTSKSVWWRGLEATKQARHGFWVWVGDMIMVSIGGGVGTWLLPSDPTLLEWVFYPCIGALVGIVVDLSLQFFLFTADAYVRRSIKTMVTDIVALQVSTQNNVMAVPAYPTPVVLSDEGRAIPALRYLLERGGELQADLRPNGNHIWGQMEQWVLRWENSLSEGVWHFMPDQAAYIMSDEGFQIRDEILKYVGWPEKWAVRRVVLERRLGRLRQVCSQVPELRMADSETEEDE